MNKQCYLVNVSKNELEIENKKIKSSQAKNEKTIELKSRKIEEYCRDISELNNKIIEFNVLMEKLIHENQRLNMIADEKHQPKANSNGYYEVLQNDFKNQKFENKYSNTLKNFRQEKFN